jgi:hypothetical protein
MASILPSRDIVARRETTTTCSRHIHQKERKIRLSREYAFGNFQGALRYGLLQGPPEYFNTASLTPTHPESFPKRFS